MDDASKKRVVFTQLKQIFFQHKCGNFTIIIIQSFQKENPMSYFSILPNLYTNYRAPAPMMYAPPAPKLPPVLAYLSQALKTSVQNYETIYNQNNVAIHAKNEQKPIQIIETTINSVIQLDKEEKVERNQNLKKEIENIEEIHANSAIITQKLNQISSQTITNQQAAVDNKEREQVQAKIDKQITVKKQKVRSKKHSHLVAVPEIDLIEAVDLPCFKLTSEQINKKRESLMLRQTEIWNQRGKNRRDKREIRMLNN